MLSQVLSSLGNYPHSLFAEWGRGSLTRLFPVSLQLLAVWVLADWMNAGQPAKCQLVELGPGRGTLAKDMLRVVVPFLLLLNSSVSDQQLC